MIHVSSYNSTVRQLDSIRAWSLSHYYSSTDPGGTSGEISYEDGLFHCKGPGLGMAVMLSLLPFLITPDTVCQVGVDLVQMRSGASAHQ